MNLRNILNYSYWLAEAPELTVWARWGMAVFFGLLLVASWLLKMISRQAEPALARGQRKISRLCAWLGVLGFLILFFRYEFVPLFSRRVIYLVWLAVALAGSGSILKYFIKQVPEIRRRQLERKQRDKYLP